MSSAISGSMRLLVDTSPPAVPLNGRSQSVNCGPVWPCTFAVTSFRSVGFANYEFCVLLIVFTPSFMAYSTGISPPYLAVLPQQINSFLIHLPIPHTNTLHIISHFTPSSPRIAYGHRTSRS